MDTFINLMEKQNALLERLLEAQSIVDKMFRPKGERAPKESGNQNIIMNEIIAFDDHLVILPHGKA